jgi:DNA-binding NarL/FixJ family response regulator
MAASSVGDRSEGPGAIRVVVADDQELVRSGFVMILDAQPDMAVVGEAADGDEAVAVARRERADVVLMDIRMPRVDGIAATRRLAGPDVADPVKVVMLTTFDLDEYVFEALRAGASGFLLKDVRRDDLVHAVRVVAAGDALLAPSVTRRLVEDFARRPGSGTSGSPSAAMTRELDRLTAREREVLELIGRGLNNAEIGATLFVGEATVKTHVGRVLMKLALRDRVQAVILAYEAGLVGPGAGGTRDPTTGGSAGPG